MARIFTDNVAIHITADLYSDGLLQVCVGDDLLAEAVVRPATQDAARLALHEIVGSFLAPHVHISDV